MGVISCEPDSPTNTSHQIQDRSYAAVKQIPANVVGDGVRTIRELVDIKNKDPRRVEPGIKESVLCPLVINEVTNALLKQQGYTVSSIPSAGEVVFVQHDPFLKWGGDLEEVTPLIHTDNILLMENVARFFDLSLGGIDFIAPDISRSWKEQACAVLELNSNPCIELHQIVTAGTPQHVGRALVVWIKRTY